MNGIHETSCPHITHILVKTNEDGRIDLAAFFWKPSVVTHTLNFIRFLQE